MTRRQIVRVGIVSLVLAAIQVAGFDRVLFFGVVYLALPLFLAVAVGRRLPWTNASIAGAGIGLAWDLLSIELFGRYALGLAAAAALSSVLNFGTQDLGRPERLARRLLSVFAATTWFVALSAFVGGALPVATAGTIAGLVVSLLVGAAISGSILDRVALPTLTVWDPAPVRSTDWMDRRAGLYSIPSPQLDREAA